MIALSINSSWDSEHLLHLYAQIGRFCNALVHAYVSIISFVHAICQGMQFRPFFTENEATQLCPLQHVKQMRNWVSFSTNHNKCRCRVCHRFELYLKVIFRRQLPSIKNHVPSTMYLLTNTLSPNTRITHTFMFTRVTPPATAWAWAHAYLSFSVNIIHIHTQATK